MFALNDHVTRKGTTDPVGLIEAFKGAGWVTVRWGVADGHIYKEAIHQDDLQVVIGKIWSPDEVVESQAKKSGTKYRKIPGG